MYVTDLFKGREQQRERVRVRVREFMYEIFEISKHSSCLLTRGIEHMHIRIA